MYIPRQSHEERPDVLARAIRDIQRAPLVTPGPEDPAHEHAPLDGGRGKPGWQTCRTFP